MSARVLGARWASSYKNYTAERLASEGKPVEEIAVVEAPARSMYDRLVERFGWGDDRSKREALYRRLDRLCVSKGKEVELWVYEAAEKASAASSPDRYFCACVVRMLRSVEVHTL